jgi:anti-sigma-K factor RskA
MSIDPHTLSGVYALDALTEEEARQFRAHLRQCTSCREEVRELRQAAARMGESDPIPPPGSLKEQVLAAADQLPQLPPKVTATERDRPQRWTGRIAAIAAAAVLIVAAGFGVSEFRSGEDGSRQHRASEDSGVAQVFEAADAREATVKTRTGATVTVATSRRLGKMAVETEALPALTDERVYQIWAIRDGTPTSAGLLEDPDQGAAMALPAPGTLVAVTVEPSGGSRTPTSAPLFEVDPRSV